MTRTIPNDVTTGTDFAVRSNCTNAPLADQMPGRRTANRAPIGFDSVHPANPTEMNARDCPLRTWDNSLQRVANLSVSSHSFPSNAANMPMVTTIGFRSATTRCCHWGTRAKGDETHHIQFRELIETPRLED